MTEFSSPTDFLSTEDVAILTSCKHWSYYIMNKELQWKDTLGYYCITYAHKGDKLFTINAKKLIRSEETYSFSVYVKCDGWYVIDGSYTRFEETVYSGNRGWRRLFCFSSIEEWEDYYFFDIKRFSYSIEDDLFEGTKIIKWNEEKRKFGSLSIEANEIGFFLKYTWNRKWRGKNEMGVGDEITLLFEDKTKLSFTSKDNPSRSSDDTDEYFYIFPISQFAVNNLILQEIVAIRVHFANGDAPCTLHRSDFDYYGLSRIWLKKNVQLYEQLGYKAEKEITEDAPKVEGKCSVYLMLDEANGYYKIGISNKPKYREHTLQSEKPSIKLICAKEYPNRRIAEAIESALHKAYSAEHMRGEWFNLTAKDVQEITQTLA